MKFGIGDLPIILLSICKLCEGHASLMGIIEITYVPWNCIIF